MADNAALEEPTTPRRAGTLPDPASAELSTRLERFGPGAWNDVELLRAVLGPGGPVEAEAAARELMAGLGSLGEIAAATSASLRQRPGMGQDRSERLLAAFELGLRVAQPVARRGLVVRRPEDLLPLLRAEFRGLDKERFLALYLDSRHRVLAVEIVSIGSLNASLVHPREVFKPAVVLSSAAIIVAHNHPSGNAQPSGDDLELTARLDRCGELLGVTLLDHLVVGDGEIVSIREYGWPASRAQEARGG